MKIITTAILLGVTLLAVPLFSYFFGTALSPLEWNALTTLITIAVIAIAATFIVGELNNNNSQVDKIWSLLPIVYAWVATDYSHYAPRLVMMSCLVTLWGIRLSINFGLKGAYQWRFWGGEEDYRWAVLREKPEFNPKWKWTLFNLFFICGYQNVLILLFTLPTIVVLQHSNMPIGLFDYMAAGLMFVFIVYETIADIQHLKFQNIKWAKVKAGKELNEHKKGFLDTGLWAHSRHPNYFAEQAIWVCFYLFSEIASGECINWSIAGCLLLIVLFHGSSNLSEELSSGKYTEYASYQKRVPRFIPFIGKIFLRSDK